MVPDDTIRVSPQTLTSKFSLNDIQTDPTRASEYFRLIEHGVFSKHGSDKNIVPDILAYSEKSGKLEMMSVDEFEAAWEKSRNTKEMRDYFESKKLHDEFLTEELKDRRGLTGSITPGQIPAGQGLADDP